MATSLTQQGWKLSAGTITPMDQEHGVVHDGQLCLGRDSHGVLYALPGHANRGGITLWKGKSVPTLEPVWIVDSASDKLAIINTTFCYGSSLNPSGGRAGVAFDGTRYPDGPFARGGFWCFGLWVDPMTNRFYCFIHNETGWGAGQDSYTAYRQEEGEPDFRHIGLITSDDQGVTWSFAGWVITSGYPCWTTAYQPDGMIGGQDPGHFCRGAGDFSFFANHEDGYLYIAYTQIFDSSERPDFDCSIYLARAPMASNGAPGAWQKFHQDEFSQPGNMGLESPIMEQAGGPCVVYNKHFAKYMMTSFAPRLRETGLFPLQVSLSDDLVTWSRPVLLAPERSDLADARYFTCCNNDEEGPANVVDREFSLLYVVWDRATRTSAVYSMHVTQP